MWYVLKLYYTLPGCNDPLTRLEGYTGLSDARKVFDHLELGYQFQTCIRLKGGASIQVEHLQLYECVRKNYTDAVAAVCAGNATLVRETQCADFDVASAPRQPGVSTVI